MDDIRLVSKKHSLKFSDKKNSNSQNGVTVICEMHYGMITVLFDMVVYREDPQTSQTHSKENLDHVQH